MRISTYSLRTGVIAYLSFLLLSAMLLIHVVMIKTEERNLIGAKLDQGWTAFHALARMIEREVVRDRSLKDIFSDIQFIRQINQVLEIAGFSGALIIGRDGSPLHQSRAWGEHREDALLLARNSLTAREPLYDFYGTTWGVLWPSHEMIRLSAPILMGSQPMGALVLAARLEPIYRTIRSSQRIVLIYIFLNTVLFVLFGIYLLSRTIVQPVHHLLHITEKFTEGEAFPLLKEDSGNEIGQLHRALNSMMKRLEQNKKELQAHIVSLEQVNSELRKAQDEIIRSEKLASVGRLATGIAHEIGNPLGIVLGYLELLQREDLGREERKDFLERTESEIMRINRIIRQLLDFSRAEGAEAKELSVHDLLSETLTIMKPQPVMAGLELLSHFHAQKDWVWGDPHQLKQVFLNIILNAADAMEEGEGKSRAGSLRIVTRNVDRFIEIKFTDTGPGISEEEIIHIFDPFFTTKEPGKGTGLGLAVSYRIMKEMGGNLRAESDGAGATLIVDIPLCEPEKKKDVEA